MANTAPMPHAPVSREIAPGVTVSNQMTPTQILEAHVKANVQPHQGGIGHTADTLNWMTYGDAQSKTPPSPAELEKANKPAAPVVAPGSTAQEQFDAEMRAKGLTVEAPLPTVEEQMKSDLALVTERYKALMQAGKSMPEESRLNFRRALENDFVRILNGQALTPAQRAQLGQTGNVETFVPKEKPVKPGVEPKPAATPTWTPAEWKSGHAEVIGADNQIPVNRLNPASLSGYTLPVLITEQTVSADVFQMLANARKAGLSQSAINKFVEEDLRAGGWLK